MKDVNQGLCDDSLVDTDKIGSGNFFWCVCSTNHLWESLTMMH